MTLESPFAAGLNLLLESEPWARERLAPFAGEALELRAPPLPPLRLAITPDGRLSPAEVPLGASAQTEPTTASLVVTLGPDALAAAVRGEEHFMRAIRVEGNARLAAEVMFLARHLRWDAEEELAKVIGDIAAHRLAGAARTVAAWHADAAQRIIEGLVEYATEERPLLVKRAELDELGALEARLRDGADRLEKRIERIQRDRG